jgi:transposase-like protein
MKEKRRTNKKYSPEFKISVILDMREHHLGYCETVRKHFNIEDGKEVNYYHRVQRWERIYLEEGEAGFYIERRGRATKMDNPKIGRPRKKQLDKQVEEDLIAENQRLRMEIEYLKKLNALVQERIERERKKK